MVWLRRHYWEAQSRKTNSFELFESLNIKICHLSDRNEVEKPYMGLQKFHILTLWFKFYLIMQYFRNTAFFSFDLAMTAIYVFDNWLLSISFIHNLRHLLKSKVNSIKFLLSVILRKSILSFAVTKGPLLITHWSNEMTQQISDPPQ